MIPNPFKTLALSAALAVFAGGAMAQQTAPGVDVENTISLTYNTGAGDDVTLPATPNHSVTFKVDRKIDLLLDTLSEPAEVTVTPGATQASIAFKLDNKGNGAQGFILDVVQAGDLDLTAAHAPATGDLGVDEYWIFTSTTNNFAAATGVDNFDPTSVSSGNIGDIASDEALYIWIVANVATTTVNGLEDTFTLTATVTAEGTIDVADESRSANITIENVIHADAETQSSLTSDTYDAGDGADSDQGSFLIEAPIITATKEVAVLDENMPGSDYTCSTAMGTAVVDSTAPAFIPGACIEYTITVTNAASANANASAVMVSDTVDTNLTIQQVTPFAYTGDDAGDAATTTEPSGDPTVTGTIGTLPPGVTATFTIRATIN